MPDCEMVAFQPPVAVCPEAWVKLSVQPATGALVLFVIVTLAWKTLLHWFSGVHATTQEPPGGGVAVGTAVGGEVGVNVGPPGVAVGCGFADCNAAWTA